MTNGSSELPEQVNVVRQLEQFFQLADLRCPDCGEVHEPVEEFGISDEAEWKGLMGSCLSWVLNNLEAVRDALPALEGEWAGACESVRLLLREADLRVAAALRGGPVRPLGLSLASPETGWVASEPGDDLPEEDIYPSPLDEEFLRGCDYDLDDEDDHDEDDHDEDDEDMDLAAGEYHGRRWVTLKKDTATPEALSRLDKLNRRLEESVDWGRWFSDDAGGSYSVAERLYFVLAPDHVGYRPEARSFWDAVLFPAAADDLTPAFVEGFVAGALEAWDGK